MIDMSRIASQKENENAIVNSGKLPNAIVMRQIRELHIKLGAKLPVNYQQVAQQKEPRAESEKLPI